MKFLMLMTIVLSFVTANADLNLYTDRPTDRMQVVADEFLKTAGVKVNILELPWAALKAQLEDEGPTSPADVILVKDSVYLNELVKSGRLAKMQSKFIKANVDPSMYNEYYTAISFRVRTLVYESSLDVSAINSYADLAKADYAETLCLRNSKSSYTEALVASLINRYGYNITMTMVDGWLNNLANPALYTDDSTIISDIASGKCALGIVNSYYVGMALLKNPKMPVAIKFLDQNNGGVLTNGTGAGVSVTSKQSPLALQFIEFMLRENIQKYLTGQQQDFPANKSVETPAGTKSFGTFKVSTENWSATTETIDKARDLFSEVDYL